MASAVVDAGSDHAQQLQNAIQPKLMENGWVTDENDMTLAEYVTMMIVNGRDAQGVQAELGTDLLAIGDDNPEVIDFTKWLFDQVQTITQPQQQQAQQTENNGAHQEQAQQSTSGDAMMEDSASPAEAPYVNFSHFNQFHGNRYMRQPRPWGIQQPYQQLTQHRPTGPRSMRNGSGPQRGRGGRMLNQLNRNLDRSELPDNLRRIKGAAGGVGGGRINSHSSRDAAPRGPKHSIARGVGRMLNGGRGGPQNGMGMMGAAPGVDSQQQMQFMQMMEMQANMFQQMLQAIPNGAGGPNGGRGGARGRGTRGGARGGRGGQQQAPTLHAVDGKMPDGALPSGPHAGGADGMDVDGDENGGGKFSSPCRFDLSCTNPACGFAHRGPRTTLETVPTLDMTATCSYAGKCTNKSCTARHPSPASAKPGAIPVPCKFYPNCQNAQCPFTHPNVRPCKNGGDCTTPGCTFGHSTIVCRYNPCLNQNCPYKHEAGQKRGKFEDKVWTPGDKAERFADFKKEDGPEELILPGQTNGNGVKEEFGVKQEGGGEMEADVVS